MTDSQRTRFTLGRQTLDDHDSLLLVRLSVFTIRSLSLNSRTPRL
ncbi:hypothetical protein LCGC14_2833160, partial [marine sediment metagenome]